MFNSEGTFYSINIWKEEVQIIEGEENDETMGTNGNSEEPVKKVTMEIRAGQKALVVEKADYGGENAPVFKQRNEGLEKKEEIKCF